MTNTFAIQDRSSHYQLDEFEDRSSRYQLDDFENRSPDLLIGDRQSLDFLQKEITSAFICVHLRLKTENPELLQKA